MRIIHIITIGTDHPTRILPLGKIPAISKAYLVLPEVNLNDYSDVAHERHLKEKVLPGVHRMLGDIPYEEFRVNYYEFSKTFPQAMEITQKAKKEADFVYSNITSGTKIVSIAFFLAACIEGAEAYFVIPEKFHIMMTSQIPNILNQYGDCATKLKKIESLYNEWGMNFLSIGAKKVVYLPTPPLRGHDRRIRSLIVTLADMGGESDSLEAFIAQLKKQKTLSFKSEQSIRNYVSKVVSELSEQKLLIKEKKTRTSKISLTESGKMLAGVYKTMDAIKS